MLRALQCWNTLYGGKQSQRIVHSADCVRADNGIFRTEKFSVFFGGGRGEGGAELWIQKGGAQFEQSQYNVTKFLLPSNTTDCFSSVATLLRKLT